MGGFGSGRHWHWSAKDTTDGYHTIDVRRWAREGYLEPGRSFGWKWSINGEKTGDIRVQTERGQVRLIYRTRSHGEEWEQLNYPVRLTYTECNYGGERVLVCLSSTRLLATCGKALRRQGVRVSPLLSACLSFPA